MQIELRIISTPHSCFHLFCFVTAVRVKQFDPYLLSKEEGEGGGLHLAFPVCYFFAAAAVFGGKMLNGAPAAVVNSESSSADDQTSAEVRELLGDKQSFSPLALYDFDDSPTHSKTPNPSSYFYSLPSPHPLEQ